MLALDWSFPPPHLHFAPSHSSTYVGGRSCDGGQEGEWQPRQMHRENAVMEEIAAIAGVRADLYINCLPIARREFHFHTGLAVTQQRDVYDTNKEFFTFLFTEILKLLHKSWLGQPSKHHLRMYFGCHVWLCGLCFLSPRSMCTPDGRLIQSLSTFRWPRNFCNR